MPGPYPNYLSDYPQSLWAAEEEWRDVQDQFFLECKDVVMFWNGRNHYLLLEFLLADCWWAATAVLPVFLSCVQERGALKCESGWWLVGLFASNILVRQYYPILGAKSCFANGWWLQGKLRPSCIVVLNLGFGYVLWRRSCGQDKSISLWPLFLLYQAISLFNNEYTLGVLRGHRAHPFFSPRSLCLEYATGIWQVTISLFMGFLAQTLGPWTPFIVCAGLGAIQVVFTSSIYEERLWHHSAHRQPPLMALRLMGFMGITRFRRIAGRSDSLAMSVLVISTAVARLCDPWMFWLMRSPASLGFFGFSCLVATSMLARYDHRQRHANRWSPHERHLLPQSWYPSPSRAITRLIVAFVFLALAVVCSMVQEIIINMLAVVLASRAHLEIRRMTRLHIEIQEARAAARLVGTTAGLLYISVGALTCATLNIQMRADLIMIPGLGLCLFAACHLSLHKWRRGGLPRQFDPRLPTQFEPRLEPYPRDILPSRERQDVPDPAVQQTIRTWQDTPFEVRVNSFEPALLRLPTNNSVQDLEGKRRILTDGCVIPLSQELSLTVNRAQIIESSLSQIATVSSGRLLAQRLRIHFKDEPGSDAGGVRRDWFDCLGQALCSDARLSETSQLVFAKNETLAPRPKSSTFEPNFERLFAIGRLAGLAAWFNIPLPLPINRITCKFLLGLPVQEADIQDLDSGLFSKIEVVMQDDGVAALKNTLAEDDIYFVSHPTGEFELCEGGAHMKVTEDNKKTYVKLLCQHYLSSGMEKQIQVILQGFWDIFPLEVLCAADLNHRELALLICGYPDLDVTAWEENAVTSGPSDTLSTFWQVVQEMAPADRSKLLHFATGSSRIFAGGFQGLDPKFTINIVAHRSQEHFPQGQTCFNLLTMPNYASKALMTSKLLDALNGAEGFQFA